MPNIAAVLKEEIARLAKKEAKRLVVPAAKHFAEMRKTISELRKKVAVLEGKTLRIEKKTDVSPKGIPLPKPEALDKSRLGASNIAKMRAKLGLSRGEMAKLLGVSQNSIFLWERGEAKPREAAKAKIIALRGIGKRQLKKALAEIEGEKAEAPAALKKPRAKRAVKKAEAVATESSAS